MPIEDGEDGLQKYERRDESDDPSWWDFERMPVDQCCWHCLSQLTIEEIKTLWGRYCGQRQTPHAGPGRGYHEATMPKTATVNKPHAPKPSIDPDAEVAPCPHCGEMLYGIEVRSLWGSYCGQLQTPHPGPGRPRAKSRCKCGAMTKARAKQRGHKC